MSPCDRRARWGGGLAAAVLARIAQGVALAGLVAWIASFAVGRQLGDPRVLVDADRIVGLRILDSSGELLREPLGGQGDRGRWVTLDEVSPWLVQAVLAAEDQRFDIHPGVDPLAVARAASQNVSAGRVVSGGSTITQQLVKLTTGRTRDRDLGVKVHEMCAALHYERHLEKEEILEAYLNWVPLGHLARGVQMGAWTYFHKPVDHLSLSEATALASLVRGPGALDPYRHLDDLEKRRAWVLGRMRDSGAIGDEQLRHSLAHPPEFYRAGTKFEAPHLAEEILERSSKDRLTSGTIVTTLDGSLQERAEHIVASIVKDLGEVDVSTAAVVIIHNPTGEVRAWVGSGGYFDAQALGMNDGVTARRSPGSALKPLIYAEALEHGYTPATLLADVPTAFPTPEGPYRPRNYDGAFRGPVRLREALGSSLNVPAVAVAADLGPGAVLEALHRAGFSSLDRDASYYGAAIALGDGEVTLLELAAAYAALARGGTWVEPVLVKEIRDPGGEPVPLEAPASHRVFSPETAYLITSILSDPAARAPTFGKARVFDLGFDVAVKTGTSHDYRDNWAVGYTPRYTVAAWVGNFDGKPMGNISGITGAGPLFAGVMRAASSGSLARFDPPAGVVTRRVCALSGELPGPHCIATLDEHFTASTAPTHPCSVHQVLGVDARNGLLATASCPPEHVEQSLFEVYPASMAQWAVEAGRPVPPAPSVLCSASGGDSVDPFLPGVLEPSEGAVFSMLPDLPEGRQVVRVKLTPAAPGQPVSLLVDGDVAGVASGSPWIVEWMLEPGEHLLAASVGGVTGAPVSVFVN